MKTFEKITSSQLDKICKQYIIDSLDFSGHEEIKADTDQEKIQAFFDQFNICYWSWKKKQIKYPIMQDILVDYIQGLPSFFNIAFEDYKIIELAKKWKSIPENATEKEEDKILNNYWNLIAVKTIQLFKKYKCIV